MEVLFWGFVMIAVCTGIVTWLKHKDENDA